MYRIILKENKWELFFLYIPASTVCELIIIFKTDQSFWDKQSLAVWYFDI